MPEDNVIAGIWCSEVLSDLSDFVDGTLAQARRKALEAHLESCSHCARFGSEFSYALGQLRTTLLAEGPLPPDIAQRLESRLDDD